MQKREFVSSLRSWYHSINFPAKAPRCKNRYFASHIIIKMEEHITYEQGSIKVNGSCAMGYAAVKDAFVQNFISGQETNASICVYVNQKLVVDLYGTSIENTMYKPTSLQVNKFRN